MNILAYLALLIGVLLAPPSWGAEIRGGTGGGGGGVTTFSTGTELPATCTPGDLEANGLFLDTDDNLYYFCSDTNTFTQVNPAEAQDLDDVCTVGCEITTAVSEATGAKIGDGTNKVSTYWDPTDGYVVKPDPLGNTLWRCWTNFNCVVRDVEGAKDFLIIDPDALGAGSGTLTMQTNEQFIGSNLGVFVTPSDTNPACAAGDYGWYADLSETNLKKCVNGVVTDLTGGTLTNVTLDGEGTGNTITLTEERHFVVAACQNTTAQAVFDLNTANTPAPTCDTGTNTQKAYLAFDATTDEAFQDSWILPTGFTGAIDVHFRWKAAATSGAVGWCAQLIRVPDAATSDPAFPAQASGNCVSDTAKGTTLQENTATISGVTCTSCAAGDHVYVRISRDANGGAVTDSMTGDAFLLTYGRTWRVAH